MRLEDGMGVVEYSAELVGSCEGLKRQVMSLTGERDRLLAAANKARAAGVELQVGSEQGAVDCVGFDFLERGETS